MHAYPFFVSDRTKDDPPPKFDYGTYRTLNGPAWSWREMNPSNGIFNWTNIDSVINHHHSLKKSINFSFYGTPQWAAQPQFQNTESIYGLLGFASPPQLQAYAANFITALLTRYNTGGVKKIKYLEVWNEPDFEGPLNRILWWGTASELVDLTVTVYNAAKAVDPDIIIMSPTFTNEVMIDPYFDAIGTNGEKAINFMDAFAFHPYTYDLFPQNNTPIGNISGFDGLYKRIRAHLSRAGNINLPIYMNEYGVAFAASPYLTSYLNLPALTRKSSLARRIIINGILGAKMLAIYAYGGPRNESLSGDLINDTEGAIAAINFVNQNFVGKTITHAVMGQDGKLDYIADGVKYSI